MSFRRSRVLDSDVLDSDDIDRVLMMFSMLLHQVEEQEELDEKGKPVKKKPRRVDFATACSLSGVSFSKFSRSVQMDRGPGGLAEKVEELMSEAKELVRGRVMGYALDGDLSAARIVIGSGMNINVNVGGSTVDKVLLEQEKKKNKALTQMPEQEQLEFLRQHPDIVEIE